MSAVIYVRQSLDRAGDAVAVERQLAACRKLAEARELIVVDEIVENDVSASKGERPGFARLLAALEAEEYGTVIVWHTDRLYRRVTDLLKLMAVAEKHDCRIMTVQAGDLDLGNPVGRMFATMTASVARYEVEHKGERQVAANAERAKAGERHFAQRPYGYIRENGTISIVETEASVIRESVDRIVAGESWYAIAKDLRARGIVGMSGRPFSYQNLMQRVNNPAIAGIRTYLGDVVNDSGNWPPIIDRDTWDRFQTVLLSRKQTQDWDKKIKYLGSGRYICGKCGAHMHVTRDAKNKRPVYECKNLDTRRDLERVDALVEAALFDRLSRPDVVPLLTPKGNAAELAAESQEIRGLLAGLAELYADRVLTAADVREQKKKLTKRLDDLQSKLAAIEGGTALSEFVTADSIESFWRDRMNIKAKRRLLDAFFTVTINPTRRGGRNEFVPSDVVITEKIPQT